MHQHRRASTQELVKKIGGSPYALRKYQAAAKSYHSAQALSCLRAIYRADLDFKGMGTKKSEFAILKELMIQIVSW